MRHFTKWGLDAAHTRTECNVQKFTVTFRRINYFILKNNVFWDFPSIACCGWSNKAFRHVLNFSHLRSPVGIANINHMLWVHSTFLCFPALNGEFLNKLQQRSGFSALATLVFTGYTQKSSQMLSSSSPLRVALNSLTDALPQ